MRELERNPAAETSPDPPATASVGVLGRGRVGRALGAALRDAGFEVEGPAGRGEVPAAAGISAAGSALSLIHI